MRSAFGEWQHRLYYRFGRLAEWAVGRKRTSAFESETVESCRSLSFPPRLDDLDPAGMCQKRKAWIVENRGRTMGSFRVLPAPAPLRTLIAQCGRVEVASLSTCGRSAFRARSVSACKCCACISMRPERHQWRGRRCRKGAPGWMLRFALAAAPSSVRYQRR